MPRADTVALLAENLRCSVDWLLGLSSEQRSTAEILDASLQFSPEERSSAKRQLVEWHRDAVGYKIRYVPANLPDLVKTESVNRYQYGEDADSQHADQAVAATQGRLDYIKHPDSDMEICMPFQTLEALSQGVGIWGGLTATERATQLEQMANIVAELYPGLRVTLFDGLEHFSSPYTIFGLKRAAIYLGQMYFVFSTTSHIRVLTHHFDQLVRNASVQANETENYVRKLVESVT